ncbi:MAG TPA: sigma-70 family RNA polymerase sigma factor [Burkholderiaceae bacterium]
MFKTGRAQPGPAKQGGAEAVEVRLIGAIAKGDMHAFETLYRGYFPRLTRFLDRMTRNAHLIEEIINDTMMVVWQKAATFDGTSKVSTWIFAIAYRKGLKAVSAFDDPVESDSEEYASAAENEPEQEFSQQQLQILLGKTLDTLPAEQRHVVNLAYYHGMDYGEIAEIMECPVNTVKTRMFHARRRMKTVLAPHFGEVS